MELASDRPMKDRGLVPLMKVLAMTGGCTFEPLADTNRETVRGLVRAYCAGEGYEFSSPDIERAFDDIASGAGFGHFWVIERAGEPVGYLCIAAGLAFAEKQCRALGARRLSLVTERANPRARAFYEARGYAVHDRDMLSKEL
jgi:GNAT superfamily N-acetyltransferase